MLDFLADLQEFKNFLFPEALWNDLFYFKDILSR